MNLKKKRDLSTLCTALEPPFQDLVDGSSRMGGRNGLFEGDIVGVLNRETAADGVTGRQKGTKVRVVVWDFFFPY